MPTSISDLGILHSRTSCSRARLEITVTKNLSHHFQLISGINRNQQPARARQLTVVYRF